MDFLLNLNNAYVNLFLFSIVISFALSLAMIVSFSLSKIFVNLELDKLQGTESKFDRLIIIASGAVLSTIVVVMGIMFVSMIAKCFYHNADEICYSYMKLMIIFSVILIVSYTIVAPNHSHLRFIDIPDVEAGYLCRKFSRIAIISFVITMVSYPIISIFKSTKYGMLCEYLSIGIIIIYYFTEMMISQNMISKLLSVKISKNYSVSAKLTTFLNEKFTYLSLLCMFYAVESIIRREIQVKSCFSLT
jgi:hypothetical protein